LLLAGDCTEMEGVATAQVFYFEKNEPWRIAFPRPLCYNFMYCGDEQEE